MPAKWQTWMPRVIDAWCGSANVQALSDSAYRAYDHLLMAEWQSEDGMLPSDDKSLMKASKMFARWNEVREEVLEMFQREGARLYSPRLLQEWRRAQTVHVRKTTGGGEKTTGQHELPFTETKNFPKSRSGVRYTATATPTTTSTTTPKAEELRPTAQPVNPQPIDNPDV